MSGSASDVHDKPPSANVQQSRAPAMKQQTDIFNDDSLDPVYHAKARILNEAIQEIGMGRYQWGLFFVAGFGWLSDNMWPVINSLILSPALNEFKFEGPFLTLGQGIGLFVGAVFWGVGSDVFGRRISFNITLLITAIFATSAGASSSWVTLCIFITLWSVGVGGNLPVDSAVFLEMIPASHQYLLTVLSTWWAVGQLIASLVAWPLIGNFSCPSRSPSSPPGPPCTRSANQGWRYFLYTMGGLMFILWILRFFVFHLYESPKYLMGKGRDEEAMEVVRKLAIYNRREELVSKFNVEDLTSAGTIMSTPTTTTGGDREKGGELKKMDTSALGIVKRRIRIVFGGEHVKGLFQTRALAWSTSLLIVIWALIGLAFPLYKAFLPYFLATRGADFGDGSLYITYRNQVILSVIGVPGSIMAGYLVELPILGRRGTLAISTVLTGVFLFTSTTARTSNALLGWNCAFSFTSNVTYGVLYALTPELFPTKDRGTGNALVAAANRIFGIISPIIALYANLATSVPVFIAGAIFVAAGFISLLLPFESQGKASL